jgi:hypothetical protein
MNIGWSCPRLKETHEPEELVRARPQLYRGFNDPHPVVRFDLHARGGSSSSGNTRIEFVPDYLRDIESARDCDLLDRFGMPREPNLSLGGHKTWHMVDCSPRHVLDRAGS